MSFPLNAAAIGHASNNGPRVTPALVAVPHLTPCTKRGTYEVIPNMTTPRMTPPMLEMVIIRLLKRVKGRIGSEARASWKRKRAIRTMASANKPRLGNEVQDQVTPP